MIFWIVILLCIIAQWAAAWAREKSQLGIEPPQPLFFRREHASAKSIHRALGARFGEIRLLKFQLTFVARTKGQTYAADI
jgi:hypothetical protein